MGLCSHLETVFEMWVCPAHATSRICRLGGLIITCVRTHKLPQGFNHCYWLKSTCLRVYTAEASSNQFLTPGTRDCKAPTWHRVNAFPPGGCVQPGWGHHVNAFPRVAAFSQGGLYTLASAGNDGHTTALSKLGGGKGLWMGERARNAESCGERDRADQDFRVYEAHLCPPGPNI